MLTDILFSFEFKKCVLTFLYHSAAVKREKKDTAQRIPYEYAYQMRYLKKKTIHILFYEIRHRLDLVGIADFVLIEEDEGRLSLISCSKAFANRLNSCGGISFP